MSRSASQPGLEGSRVVIFTDLDGTLLDYYTYSCEVVKPLVARLKRAGIEVVLCSSKTRAEIEIYRKRLGLDTPFIAENGGAIFIEKDYFPFPYEYHQTIGKYRVIELGIAYKEVRRKLDAVRQESRLSFPHDCCLRHFDPEGVPCGNHDLSLPWRDRGILLLGGKPIVNGRLLMRRKEVDYLLLEKVGSRNPLFCFLGYSNDRNWKRQRVTGSISGSRCISGNTTVK